jgi:hypothetical protein
MKSIKATGILILILITSAFTLSAQDLCKTWLPSYGDELVYDSYDKKGRHYSTYSIRLMEDEMRGDTIVYYVQNKLDYDDSEESIRNEIEYKCIDNKFILDMNTFVKEEQMAAFKNSEIEVDINALFFPEKLEPGMKLNDGYISLKVVNSPIKITSNTKIYNRKVESIETIVLPAGTFEAYKISSEIESKMSLAKVYIKSVSWYVAGIGSVKDESFNKKGKLIGSNELKEIIKHR